MCIFVCVLCVCVLYECLCVYGYVCMFDYMFLYATWVRQNTDPKEKKGGKTKIMKIFVTFVTDITRGTDVQVR